MMVWCYVLNKDNYKQENSNNTRQHVKKTLLYAKRRFMNYYKIFLEQFNKFYQKGIKLFIFLMNNFPSKNMSREK